LNAGGSSLRAPVARTAATYATEIAATEAAKHARATIGNAPIVLRGSSGVVVRATRVIMLALRRPDVWPAADLTLRRAVERVWALDAPASVTASCTPAARAVG